MIVTQADFANLSMLGGPLKRLLRHADARPSDAVPPDVATMNSCIVLAYESTGVRRVVTLVYPPDANAALDRVSVLDPLGMALLGARPGALILEELRVIGIAYQPERTLREGLVTNE